VLSVTAADPEGGALQYTWTADAGSVSGAGSSAVFTPPAVSSSAVVTITVTISDGQGGTVSNSSFVTVTP